MPKKKIMFVFGTRPEAIKLAPVIIEAALHAEQLEAIVTVTGQHKEMLDQVLKIFNLKPKFDLKVMEEGQSVSSVVSKSLKGLEDILKKGKPDMIVVQGDTSTTFAAALSAFYHKVPLAHVEAGLRTWDKYKPFPEEMNRKLTSVLSDLHFAPTKQSVENLKQEGIDPNAIFLTGNTVVDALFNVSKRQFDLKNAGVKIDPNKKLILVTAHRRESFGEPLEWIANAVKEIATRYSSSVQVVIPVHRNPEVRKTVEKILKGLQNVILTGPMEYEPFVHLMKQSYLILTDSGGIQEEAPSLAKPVLVLREVTERPEGVESGTVKLVGVRTDYIVQAVSELLDDEEEYQKMSRAKNPYGDGKASARIVQALLNYFGLTKERPEEFICAKP